MLNLEEIILNFTSDYESRISFDKFIDCIMNTHLKFQSILENDDFEQKEDSENDFNDSE